MAHILITGAAGNLGQKAAAHLRTQHQVTLLDRVASDGIQAGDISDWDPAWTSRFQGVDGVLHLAGNSDAAASWPDLIGPNLDGMLHVLEAARLAGVRRFVFASSNHVMGGYQGCCGPGELTVNLPPRPGARYVKQGVAIDSTPYATTKSCGERIAKFFAEQHSLQVVAARIGWNKPGVNRWENIDPARGSWFQQMWLSNRDANHLFERCLSAPLPSQFIIVHGMSNNAGMPWDLTTTREQIGYEPQDGGGRV